MYGSDFNEYWGITSILQGNEKLRETAYPVTMKFLLISSKGLLEKKRCNLPPARLISCTGSNVSRILNIKLQLSLTPKNVSYINGVELKTRLINSPNKS